MTRKLQGAYGFLTAGAVAVVIFAAGYVAGGGYEATIESYDVLADAQAAGSDSPMEWSPTKPYPRHDVYYPGTEELAPDEMRVIACGTGMPTPRLKQAAGCFVVELGNGDKFIFDMGEGSYERLSALGIPLD